MLCVVWVSTDLVLLYSIFFFFLPQMFPTLFGIYANFVLINWWSFVIHWQWFQLILQKVEWEPITPSLAGLAEMHSKWKEAQEEE